MNRLPLLHQLDRLWQYLTHEVRALAFVHFPALVKSSERAAKRHLDRQVSDLAKRAALTPDYPMGCKRILISNNYYPALDQKHVNIVSDGIEKIVPEGVVTNDGTLHPADVLIYGTGFAATEFLAPIRISGLDGRDLNDVWRDGAEAYKGISVAGFPNLYVLYGPNTNLGHNSIIYMLESQFRYVVACVKAVRDRGLRYLDLQPEVQVRYNRQLQDDARGTVWARGCQSWYLTADGKQTVNWPGFTFTYRYMTRKPTWSDYVQVR